MAALPRGIRAWPTLSARSCYNGVSREAPRGAARCRAMPRRRGTGEAPSSPICEDPFCCSPHWRRHVAVWSYTDEDQLQRDERPPRSSVASTLGFRLALLLAAVMILAPRRPHPPMRHDTSRQAVRSVRAERIAPRSPFLMGRKANASHPSRL